jgi:hypothetical protein
MSDASLDYAKYDGDSRSSWERLAWIEENSNRSSAFGMPKHPSVDVVVEISTAVSVRIENSSTIQNRSASASNVSDTNYPAWLINVFSGGLVAAAIGVILLVITSFVTIKRADTAGGILAAIGTISVAFAVLRGQDIGGRT